MYRHRHSWWVYVSVCVDLLLQNQKNICIYYDFLGWNRGWQCDTTFKFVGIPVGSYQRVVSLGDNVQRPGLAVLGSIPSSGETLSFTTLLPDIKQRRPTHRVTIWIASRKSSNDTLWETLSQRFFRSISAYPWQWSGLDRSNQSRLRADI